MGWLKTSVAYCLNNLFRFSGRDTRSQFWPFTILALAAAMLLGMAHMAIEGAMALGAGGAPDVGRMLMGTMIVPLIFIVLVAAAACRRLRDAGLSPWWLALPALFLAFWIITFPAFMDAVLNGDALPEPLGTLLLVNNIAYNVAVLVTAVLLARKSRPGPEPEMAAA